MFLLDNVPIKSRINSTARETVVQEANSSCPFELSKLEIALVFHKYPSISRYVPRLVDALDWVQFSQLPLPRVHSGS